MLIKNSLISLLGVGEIIGVVGSLSFVYSNKELPKNVQKDNLNVVKEFLIDNSKNEEK